MRCTIEETPRRISLLPAIDLKPTTRVSCAYFLSHR